MEIMRPIDEIVDIDVLQKIQDDFAHTMEMSFVTVDYKGNPITKYSGFTKFCEKARSYPDMLSLCNQCDAHGGLHAAITGNPHIYKCHAGLLDSAVPLVVDGTYCGSVLGGQIHPAGEGADDLKRVMDFESDWKAIPELIAARKEIKVMDMNRVHAVLSILQSSIQNLLQKGYNELLMKELDEKNKEMLGEKRKRVALEESLKVQETKTFMSRQSADFLFSNLSVISNLAYVEQADKTAQAIFALADMLRYSSERGIHKIATLEEELEYIQKYLFLEEVRLGDKLTYRIDIPERYNSMAFPTMMLKPIIENAIEYTVESEPDGGKIQITGAEEGGDLLISIADAGKGFAPEVIENILNEERPAVDEENRYELYNINRNLSILFGKNYKLQISNLPDEQGAVVTMRIPMNSNIVK